MNPPNTNDRRTATFLGLAFFLLYVATFCPTVFRGDSGEIVTAICSGGIIHPPGYPLFMLLGRLFLGIIPLGEPAFRLGVLVALAGVGAVIALYYLIRELDVPPTAALATTALFGVGMTFWNQCNRVEVYSLHAFLALTAVAACLSYRRTGQVRSRSEERRVGKECA